MGVKPGVWVIDHYDSDTKKFFYHHRLVSVQPEMSIDELIQTISINIFDKIIDFLVQN